MSKNPTEGENFASKKTRIFNTLFKDNGEGSETPPTKNSKLGGSAYKNVIGWEDFSYDTESESESTHRTVQNSQIIGDGVETFKKKVVNITTKEEILSTKEQVENALQQYKSSGTNVPAFKEQVSGLEEKIKICENKLFELENKDKAEGKGKGKQLLEDNPSPRRVLNPNYQPAPRGGSTQRVGYTYDSDEEEEAIHRAIEESLKSNSSKEESSSKGKNV